MVASNLTAETTRPTPLDPPAEALLARLTSTAYDVALRHGIKGAFTDLELALWQGLRDALRGDRAAA